MEFKKYNSITLLRPSREDELGHFQMAFGDSRCVVTEKIHGSNMSVETDGTDTTFSRRTAQLEPDEEFYGYQYIVEPLTQRITDMFKDVSDMNTTMWEAYDVIMKRDGVANVPELPRDIESIKITGEFCGGHYPDAPVCKVGSGQVGKGKIWYSQVKTFLAFELEINGVIQDVYTMASLCQSFSIPTVPFLAFGTFQECLDYSKEHLEDDSTVYSMIPLMDTDGTVRTPLEHLPSIKGNTREGHVIAPVNPQYFFNGKRMMLKHKSAGHTENAKVKQPVRLIEFTKEQQYVFDAILSGITVARMEAVLSKEAYVASDFAKVMGLVVEDSIEDCWGGGFSIFGAKWQVLNTKQRKQVTKRLNREAALKLRTAYFS